MLQRTSVPDVNDGGSFVTFEGNLSWPRAVLGSKCNPAHDTHNFDFYPVIFEAADIEISLCAAQFASTVYCIADSEVPPL